MHHKTMRAFKLFQTKKSRPGELFPLFIGKHKPTPIGEWVNAEFIPTKGFAPRPGWHVGTKPQANHLMCNDGTMPKNRVWCEVEIPAILDYTELAQQSPTGDLRGEVPVMGFYRFKRPEIQGGEWIIAGAIRVLRVLSQAEVDLINSTEDDHRPNQP